MASGSQWKHLEFTLALSKHFFSPLNLKTLVGTVLVQYRSKICGPKCVCKTRLRVKHARVCVFETRMKYAHKAKLISMYELAHCRPIVVISLLVLIAFYCINVYGNGYSDEHRLANPAPCLFQFTVTVNMWK